MEANGKINWISEAKGFAILGVVAVHTVQQFSVAYVSSIAHAGRFCVQLFFIISAYLTFTSLDKNPADWTVQRYCKYLAHKILRFIPVLYTAVLWHFISYTVELGHLPAFRDDIWKKAFFALTFLNGFSYHYVNPWMNWYIGTLVVFLVIAPLLKRLIDTPKKSVLFFAFSRIDIRDVSGYTVVASFSKVGGLGAGADVRIAGLKVGSVLKTELNQEDYTVDVYLNIDSDVRLPIDTVAAIADSGIMGDKYIRLEPGKAQAVLQEEGHISQTKNYKSLEDSVSEFIFLSTK